MQKSFFRILLMLLLAGFASAFAQAKKILVFSKTDGFYHKAIPDGLTAIQKLGTAHQFEVDTTKDAGQFNAANLKKYAAVVFLNTTHNVLNPDQQQAFEKFIQSGGGFAGIHAASDTEFDWPWYGKLVGAYFVNHPKIQEAKLTVVNRKTIATRHLPAVWKTTDEWYNFKEINPNINILLNIEESSYTGGTNGSQHPMAWYHNFDGGRAFYTGLGHVSEAYADPLYLQHLLGGLMYAMGAKSME